MSRDLKMRRAVGTHGTLHRIEDLQKRHDTKQTLPTLLCDSDGCGASVRFVPERSTTSTGNLPVLLPAYITLSRGAAHQAGCRYDAPARLQSILPQALTRRSSPHWKTGNTSFSYLSCNRA